MLIRHALMWVLRDLALSGDKQAMALQRRIIDESGIADPKALSGEEVKKRIQRLLMNMGVELTSDE